MASEYTLGGIKPGIKLTCDSATFPTVRLRSGFRNCSVPGGGRGSCRCSLSWSLWPGEGSAAGLHLRRLLGFPKASCSCSMDLVLALARGWGHCHCVRQGGAVTSIWVLVTSLFSVPSKQGLPRKKVKQITLKNDQYTQYSLQYTLMVNKKTIQ